MKRLLLLILVAVGIAQCVDAQTFYEVRYKDTDGDEFIGLLIHYNENNCKMRMIATQGTDESVYESAYTQAAAGKDDEEDVGVLVYAPEDDKNGFPYFLWTWSEDDASDVTEVPYVVYDMDSSSDKWVKAQYFEEVALADMDEEYVSQFYGAEEPEYALLLNGAQSIKENEKDDDAVEEQPIDSTPFYGDDSTPENADKKRTLHLFVVANTKVSDIGEACKVDLDNVRGEFGGIAKALKTGYNEIFVTGDNYGKEELQKAITKFKPSPDDIVVFVYTGHGFRFEDQKDYYPMMDLTSTAYDDINSNFVAMSDVYKEIVNKGARLNIVVSDCCNARLSTQRPVKGNTLFSRSSNNYNIEKLQQLFLKSKGNLLATAASPGEYSWCGSTGGFFLLSMIQSIREQISVLNNKPASWDVLIQKTIDNAKQKSESTPGTKAQNGVKFAQIKAL